MTKPTDELDESLFEPADKLEEILVNLAWSGRYTDSGQDVISESLVKEAKAAIQALINAKLAVPTRFTADGRGWVHIDDVDKLINKARIEEHEKSISSFQREYDRYVKHQNKDNLTEIGKACLKELSERSAFHNVRIAELKATQGESSES